MEGVEACGGQGRTEGERPAGGGRWRRAAKGEIKKNIKQKRPECAA